METETQSPTRDHLSSRTRSLESLDSSKRDSAFIRVLVADAHQLLRQGARRLLETDPDIRVVGEAGDGPEVQWMAQELQPDVILMDVNLGLVDGMSALRQLLRQLPWLKIVMMTMRSQDGHLSQALRAGAIGYILKTASVDQFLCAVRAAAVGETVVTPSLAVGALNESPTCCACQTGRAGAGNSDDALL